jgi:hypothetical protein
MDGPWGPDMVLLHSTASWRRLAGRKTTGHCQDRQAGRALSCTQQCYLPHCLPCSSNSLLPAFTSSSSAWCCWCRRCSVAAAAAAAVHGVGSRRLTRRPSREALLAGFLILPHLVVHLCCLCQIHIPLDCRALLLLLLAGCFCCRLAAVGDSSGKQWLGWLWARNGVPGSGTVYYDSMLHPPRWCQCTVQTS